MKAQDLYNEKVNAYSLFAVPGSVHAKIISAVGEGKTVLDVGCSTGYLGAELKKKNNKVFGVGISSIAAREADKVLNGVVVGDVEARDLPFSEKQFDVIVCADVLEHLFQPLKTLQKLRKYLKDEGVLIVSVPNIAHWSIRLNLLFGRFEYQENGILDSGHIRLFTFANARRMIRDAGFNIKRHDLTLGMPKGLNKLFNWLGVDKIINIFLSFKEVFASQFIFYAEKSGI